MTRGEASARLDSQQEKLGLPTLPTTTIGSYPQTSAIRVARAALRKGDIDETGYVEKMRAEIADVIALQEKIGLDVLVHGEPERNDMVQYFAEQLDGFFATVNGWVQSYGARCVRPPILFGDVVRPQPMTVDWITYAQSLTGKPVKGMLTGPVTILAWSFVRNDQPLADSSDQIALAIRDETVDLEAAGVGIIQVDEPALRELLPLRDADKPAYLNWAVRSFRLSTSGVADDTQIHTHLCYSEFGEVIGAIAELDADVTLHRGGPVEDGGPRRTSTRSASPTASARCLRHPLPACPRHRRDRRIPFGRTQNRRPAAPVGQPRLRPENRGTEGGGRLPDQPRRGHRTGPRRAVARSGVRVTGPFETWSARKLTRPLLRDQDVWLRECTHHLDP